MSNVRAHFSALEPLEDRIAPALTVGVNNQTDVLTISSDGESDAFTITQTSTGRLRVTDTGTSETWVFTKSEFASVVVTGNGGDDVLTITRASNTDPINGKPLSFTGGGQAGDALVIEAPTAIAWRPSGTAGGAGSVTGFSTGSGAQPITYQSLGKVVFNGASSLTVVTPAGIDDFILSSGASGFGRVSGLSNGQQHVAEYTAAPTLTLDLGASDTTAGAAQADRVTVQALAGALLRDLTIRTGDGADALEFGAGLSSFALPVAGGVFTYEGGAGADSVKIVSGGGYTLTDLQLTLSGGSRLGYTGVESFDLLGAPFTYTGADTQTATWTPSGAVSGEGRLVVNSSGGVTKTINFNGAFSVTRLASLEVATPAGVDTLTLGSAGAGIGRISGTVNGQAQTGDFSLVDSLTLDLGAADALAGTARADRLTVQALAGTGLQNLTLRTGDGDDALELPSGVSSFALPTSGGAFTFDGGAGADSIKVASGGSYTLTDTQLTLANGSRLNYSNAESFDLLGGPYTYNGADTQSATWLPSATVASEGRLVVTSSGAVKTIDYHGALTVTRLASLEAATPAGADVFALSASGGFGTLSGQVGGGGLGQSVRFANVANLTVDLAASDGAAGANDQFTVTGLGAPGLNKVTVKTGAGDDTLALQVNSLTLPVANDSRFDFQAGQGSDRIVASANTSVTLSNDAASYQLGFGAGGTLNYSAVENFDLAVDALVFSGSTAETAVWNPSGTAAHEGLLTVDLAGETRRTIAYRLDAPSGGNMPLALRGLASLTLETPAGSDLFDLNAGASTGLVNLVGAVGAGGVASGVAQSASLTKIGQVTLDFGKNDSAGAADKLVVKSLQLEGLQSLTVATGAGDDTLELSPSLPSLKLGLANSQPAGRLVFQAGAGENDLLKAVRAANAGPLELGSDTLAYGATTPMNFSEVEIFDLTADRVNLSGFPLDTVELTPDDELGLGGGRTLIYHGQLGLANLATLRVITKEGVNELTLGGAGGTLSGFSGNVQFVNVAHLIVDLGARDGANPVADRFVISSLSIPGLQNLTVVTGAGDDSLEVGAGVASLQLPVAGGGVKFDAGEGNDKISVSVDLSMALGQVLSGDPAGEALVLQDNSPDHLTLVQMEFIGKAVEIAELTGGGSDNRFLVKAWTHSASLSGLGGNDYFDLAGGMSGPGTLLGGEGDDSFLIQSTDAVSVDGFTGDATLDGGNGADTIIARGNVNFILTDTDLTRTIAASKTTPAVVKIVPITGIEAAELTGGSRPNLLDAGLFSGIAKLVGRGGIDNLVAARKGGELIGFEETQPTAAQLKVRAFALFYTRDNYFMPDGTLDSVTSLFASRKISNAISFRYVQSADPAVGVEYTLQSSSSANSQNAARAAGQQITVELVEGTGAFDVLQGSSYADNLKGSSRTNILSGLGGNDSLTAVGTDYLYGGAGVDKLFGPTPFKFQANPFVLPVADGRSPIKVRPPYQVPP